MNFSAVRPGRDTEMFESSRRDPNGVRPAFGAPPSHCAGCWILYDQNRFCFADRFRAFLLRSHFRKKMLPAVDLGV